MLKKIIVTSIVSMLMCSASFAAHVGADVSASAITGVNFAKGTENGTPELDQVMVNLKSDLNEFSELNVNTMISGDTGSLILTEAYVTFEDLIANTTPLPSIVSLKSKFGRQYLDFGSSNVYRTDSTFASRSLATAKFLGSYGSPLRGDGVRSIVGHSALDGLGQISFSTLETLSSSSALGLTGKVFSLAYDNNVAGIDFGVDYLTDLDSDDATTLMGLNASFDYETPMGNSLALSAELYSADYSSNTQTGTTVSALYGLNESVDLGVRYSMLGEHASSADEENAISLLVTRQLGDLAQSKFEYTKLNEADTDTFTASIYVGIH